MARQGLQRGFNQGILQGVKTGYAMGNHRTGFAGGITDGTANMYKISDPGTFGCSEQLTRRLDAILLLR